MNRNAIFGLVIAGFVATIAWLWPHHYGVDRAIFQFEEDSAAQDTAGVIWQSDRGAVQDTDVVPIFEKSAEETIDPFAPPKPTEDGFETSGQADASDNERTPVVLPPPDAPIFSTPSGSPFADMPAAQEDRTDTTRSVVISTTTIDPFSPRRSGQVRDAGTTQTTGSIELPAARRAQAEADWNMFAQGRIAELVALITERQMNDPGWTPPDGLLDEIARRDARVRISNAVSVEQYQLANRLLEENPNLLTCKDIWFGWSAVQAIAGINDDQRAIELARRLEVECEVSETDLRGGLLRLANHMRPETMHSLIDMLGNDISPELADDLGRAVARQRIYGWIAEQDAAYERRKAEAGHENTGIDNVDNIVQRRFPEIEAGAKVHAAVDALEVMRNWSDWRDRSILGWYYYHSGDFSHATDLFSNGVNGLDDDVRYEFGLAETWSRFQDEDFLGAERILPALAFPEPDSYKTINPYLIVIRALIVHTHRPEEDKLYAGIWDLSPQVQRRVYSTAFARRDPTLSQQIGWLEQRSCRCGEAVNWFRRSLDEDGSQEEAAWGLAICLQREGRDRELEALRAEWASLSPRIAGMIGRAGGRLLTAPRMRSADIMRIGYRAPLRGAMLEQAVVGGMLLDEVEVPGCWPSQMSVADLWTLPPAPRATELTALRPVPVATVQPAPVRSAAQSTPSRQTRTEEIRPRHQTASVTARSSGIRSAASCRPGSDPAAMSAALALAHGWCLMELGRPFEAVAAFERASRSGNRQVREDANYGRSLAYMRKGLTAEATASIRSSSNAPERFREIDSATLAENALAAYRGGNYAQAAAFLEARQRLGAMPVDLVVLQGWCYYKTGRESAARQLWTAAARTGSADAAGALQSTSPQ